MQRLAMRTGGGSSPPGSSLRDTTHLGWSQSAEGGWGLSVLFSLVSGLRSAPGKYGQLAMITFTQTNLHKSAQASILAGQALESSSNKITLITEPHTINNKLYAFPRGTTSIFSTDCSIKLPPRAAIVATKDTGLTSLGKWCHRDCAVGIAKIRGRETVIASVYMDINKDIQPQWLHDLIQMTHTKGYALLIGMDSNAHSALFGPDNNTRGDQLEDMILQHGLTVENIGDIPTFEARRGNQIARTFIDVTLSRNLSGLSDWRVDRTFNASDHNNIHFSIRSDNVQKRVIRPWSKADWPKFTDHLTRASYEIPAVMTMKKLDRLVERIYKDIDLALDKACPKISFIEKTKNSHWATDEHAKCKKEVSDLYSTAKRSNLEQDWDAYKKANKAFKRLCNRDKNRAWRHYKESLQTTKEVSALVKLAQRNDRSDINTLTKEDGSSTAPGKETVDLLTSTHFPAASNLKHVTYNNRRNLPTADINNKYQDWISIPLVQRALLGFEKKKSPGPDELKPLIFDYLPPQFIAALTSVYKACIHLGYTPKLWKQTKVIFISKPGKSDYLQPKAFRPISLSNYLLKGLERLVSWKMDSALAHHPLHHKQHGFLTGKGTESAISNTTDYIEQFIMKRQHCVGIFLDISSAFDSIHPGHVRQALLKHGGDPDLVQWYHGYISHRDIYIDMHGDTARFSTGIGFPQGGVCSAKFWLIAFDYAIQIINRYKIEGNGYADDCAALAGGRRLDHALNKLQKMLNELTQWGKTCGLRFNPEKSVAVLFTRRRKKPPFPLTIDGKPIEFKQEVKYLGVTLDSKLHWTPHINDKITKAKRFLQGVAAITRNNWGPKPKLMRWAYLGVVRPMLCYAAMIWGHRAPESVAKLRRVNRMALNTFANFPKSTPTTALEIALDVMPLHLFCLQEALATKSRLRDLTSLEWDGVNSNKTHSVSHLRYWENKLEEHHVDLDNQDRCLPTNPTRRFAINLDSFDGKSKHRLKTQCNIYTDGSKVNNSTGCGYSITVRGEEHSYGKFKLPDHATVFQAEVAAVEEAAKSLLTDPLTNPMFVKIFIDSQAAILALKNTNITSRTVNSAVHQLNTLALKMKKVTLVWIPAQKGHVGNERADQLAKGGATSTDAPFLSTPKPASYIKNEVRSAAYEQWTSEWRAQNTANHARSFYARPCHVKARYVIKLARLELGRFVRIISGHNNLNFFQTKIRLWNDPLCRFCGEDNETFTHLAQSCPSFLVTRGEIFPDGPPRDDLRWSVRAILNFSYVPAINLAYEGTWAHGDHETLLDLRTPTDDPATSSDDDLV